MRSLTKIPFLLLTGGVLHLCVGLLYFFHFGGAWSHYVGFPAISGLGFFLALLLRKRASSSDFSSYCLLLCLQLALLQNYFFFPAEDQAFAHAVGSLLMLVAVLDGAPVMTLTARRLNALGASASTMVALWVEPEFRSPVVGCLLLLLLLWKSVVNSVYRRVLAKRVKDRQLDAFRATVVTLNHEFNNLASISAGLLMKIRSNRSRPFLAEPEDLDMLERNLNRLVALIKSFRRVETYDEVTYLGSVKMVDIPPSNTPSSLTVTENKK